MSALQPGEAEQPRRPVIIRTPRAAQQLIADGPIIGLDGDPRSTEPMDDELRQTPWYIIDTFDDLDRLMAGLVAKEAHAAAAIAEWAQAKARFTARRSALLARFAHLVPTPGEGKSYKDTRGAASMGNYRMQPDRLPELVVANMETAKAAGITRIKYELDMAKAREQLSQDDITPDDLGLKAIPQLPVSYSLPKQSPGMAHGMVDVELGEAVTA